jgi:hypothetical protein
VRIEYTSEAFLKNYKKYGNPRAKTQTQKHRHVKEQNPQEMEL